MLLFQSAFSILFLTFKQLITPATLALFRRVQSSVLPFPTNQNIWCCLVSVGGTNYLPLAYLSAALSH